MPENYDPEDTIEVEGSQFTLADIAGFDLGEVEAKRFVTLPIGLYRWEVTDGKIYSQNTKNGKDGVIDVEITCQEVLSKVDPKREIHEDDLLNAKQHLKFFIKNDGFGRFVAFLEDIGIPKRKDTVQNFLDEIKGREFLAKIRHQKDQNNTDITYANVDMSSIKLTTNGKG